MYSFYLLFLFIFILLSLFSCFFHCDGVNVFNCHDMTLFFLYEFKCDLDMFFEILHFTFKFDFQSIKWKGFLPRKKKKTGFAVFNAPFDRKVEKRD